MIKIEEYMKLSKVERQSHVKLNEPCIERGGYIVHGTNSYMVKGLLAHILDTTIPVKFTLAGCLHACGNGKCSNPNHLYWGSHAENMADALDAQLVHQHLCSGAGGDISVHGHPNRTFSE